MYKKSAQGWVKHLDFILLDLLCLQVALVLAYMLRHGALNPYHVPLYRRMAVFFLVADMGVMFVMEPFQDVVKRSREQELRITARQVLFVELLGVMYLFSVKEGQLYSRVVMYLTGILYAVFSYVVRLLWKRLLRVKMQNAEGRSVLLVAAEESADKLIADICGYKYERFRIAGLVLIDQYQTEEKRNGIPVVAASDAADYAGREWIDEVFIGLTPEYKLPEGWIQAFMEAGVTVHLRMDDILQTAGTTQFVEKIAGYPVLTSSLNSMTFKQAFMKRLMDIIGGIVGCVLTVLLFFVLAPVIYLQSPGRIFFSQMRIGRNGKPFKIYKFRSMYLDADERKKELAQENRVPDGRMFYLEFDPRVIGNKILPDGRRKTGIGAFIRKTGLDEFPQFWNVLRGQMSLVGTRPPLLTEVDSYQRHHYARLAVKPGITGMWQVNGRNKITDFEEVVKLDMQYINEWSLGLDLKIILKTIFRR